MDDQPIDNLSNVSEREDEEELQAHDTQSGVSQNSPEDPSPPCSENEDGSPTISRRLRPHLFYSGRDCTRCHMNIRFTRQISNYDVRGGGNIVEQCVEANTAVQCWNQLVENNVQSELFRLLEENTNRKVKNLRYAFSRDRDACNTSIAQLKAMVCLLYLGSASVFRVQ